MARYHEIADDLRARIKKREWKVGDKLPGISALQEHYNVERSPGTIRSAQQLLVAEGMLRTEQGVGAFVTATEPTAPADVAEMVAQIHELANEVLVQLLQSRINAEQTAKNRVSFVLTDDLYYVLDTALREFADRTRGEAQDAEAEDAPATAESRRQWAVIAEGMRTEIDAALG